MEEEKLSSQRAAELALECGVHLAADNLDAFWGCLQPVLKAKISDESLALFGEILGEQASKDPERYFRAFDEMVEKKSQGCYVIVAKALSRMLETHLEQCCDHARDYIAQGESFEVSDYVGQGVLGQALVKYFDQTVGVLDKLSHDESRWVRRSVGAAVQFFSEEVRDADRNQRLLELTLPLMATDDDVVLKGVGWGLKTIGRYHPKLLEKFLKTHIGRREISLAVVKKAVAYLNPTVGQDLIRQASRHQ
ncbi:MAG: DNA alkylation repair protein [Candidatus Eisenbacteria sp.]|nr:DNA alkylation repair protein [Candidatus Eisenbacteria bacterium]